MSNDVDTRELPYMRLWVKDLLTDPAVMEMDLEEFGAYMRLLGVSWMKGGIPADHKRVAKLLGVTPAKFRRLWDVIGPKWVSNGNGHLINPRQEREREAVAEKSNQAREAVEKRWREQREREAKEAQANAA